MKPKAENGGMLKQFRNCLLVSMLAFAVSCAGTGMTAPSGEYLGTAKGRYAAIHYRVEDGQLLLVFENTTTAAMSNLIVNVSQKTSAGSSDMQSSTKLLKVHNYYQIRLSMAPNTTGEVLVSYYFVPKSEGGIGLSPYQSSDFAANIPGSEYGSVIDDAVEFRIAVR